MYKYIFLGSIFKAENLAKYVVVNLFFFFNYVIMYY
ncbi:hypothetical protein FWK35_00033283 [Aphis craccivora]|uniref:Uncharacterized protein n=1 Tax=Aphis craccivora TaxID=307492 RepID=A0A6G0Y8M7_APHCR|nr:hypothetical protein FWK35_00033283 [Aphis craccivora]